MTRLGLAAIPGAIAAAGPALADPYDGGWGYGHMMFGGLAMILFWGGLILAIVLAVRYLGMPGSGGRGDRRDPLDILRERYARGEIDDEEYRRRRQALDDRA